MEITVNLRRVHLVIAAAVAATVAVVIVVLMVLGGSDIEQVGPDGAESIAQDGARLSIPASAAAAGASVSAQVVDLDEAPSLPGYASDFAGVWEFTVEGGITGAATIHLPAPAAERSWVALHFIDDQWRPIGFALNDDEVVVDVESLGVFGIAFLDETVAVWNRLSDSAEDVADDVVERRADGEGGDRQTIEAAGGCVLETGMCVRPVLLAICEESPRTCGFIERLVELGDVRGESVYERLSPPSCSERGADIVVDDSTAQRLLSGCVNADSPVDLWVQNDRRFWIEACPVGGGQLRDESAASPFASLSRCGGTVLPFAAISTWEGDLREPFAVRASLGAVPVALTTTELLANAAMAILRIGGDVDLAELMMTEDGAAAILDAVTSLERSPELAPVFAQLEAGDVSAGLESLAGMMATPSVADTLVQRALLDSGLLHRLGVHLASSELNGFVASLAIVDVLVAIGDVVESAPAEDGPFGGAVVFSRPGERQPASQDEESATETEASDREAGQAEDDESNDDDRADAEAGQQDDRDSASEQEGDTVSQDGETQQSDADEDAEDAVDVSAARLVDLSSAWEHTCALLDDGSIECWGESSLGRLDVPPGRYTLVDVGGAQHSCAITEDERAVCWGSNEQGQLDVPRGRYIDVAAAGDHTCALTTDGSAVCWGDNEYGQSSPPRGTFVDISARWQYNCGLTDDAGIVWLGSESVRRAQCPSGSVLSGVCRRPARLRTRHYRRRRLLGSEQQRTTRCPDWRVRVRQCGV